jgi:hypothetical protein
LKTAETLASLTGNFANPPGKFVAVFFAESTQAATALSFDFIRNRKAVSCPKTTS